MTTIYSSRGEKIKRFGGYDNDDDNNDDNVHDKKKMIMITKTMTIMITMTKIIV